MNELFLASYRFHRKALPPAGALANARLDSRAGKRRYETPTGFAGGSPFKVGSDLMVWVERPDTHLRRVGFSDQITKGVQHRGWYASDSEDPHEVFRGVVFRLPSRGGVHRYMYGYADPWNDGPAALSLTPADDLDDAARWADDLARFAAEAEREGGSEDGGDHDESD